jgi:hypothetical protein
MSRGSDPAIPPKPVSGAPTGIVELLPGAEPVVDFACGRLEDRGDEPSFTLGCTIFPPALDVGGVRLTFGRESPPEEIDGNVTVGNVSCGKAVLEGVEASGAPS